MNHLLATLLLLSISMSACAQKINETDVPQPVKTAFATKFPTATGVKWELEDATEYEAEFKENGKERSATFSATGQWMETETEMKPAELPAAVTQAIATSFAGSKVKETETVETPDRGTFYEVELEQGERTLEVQFAADGTVLKQAVEEETKDDDKD
ncbi:MAG: PepSY-like domain-containing protein [Flavobacteriales bacterium]|nr:PepSY-like domain-containing protein [Flavobacteriales bacterium]MBK9288086.1 PepSY-like domain-containing protein [Flavobacteriales bacterium]